jgi:hypothetical protein
MPEMEGKKKKRFVQIYMYNMHLQYIWTPFQLIQYIWTHQAKEVMGKSCNQLTHLDKSGTNITPYANLKCLIETWFAYAMTYTEV